MDSNHQIQEIIDETNKSLCFLNKLIQGLYEKHLNSKLNDNFLEETMAFFGDEVDRQRFRKYMRKYQLTSEQSMKPFKIVEYNNGDVYEGEFINEKKEGKGIYK